mgnify:CR=1 FL=1
MWNFLNYLLMKKTVAGLVMGLVFVPSFAFAGTTNQPTYSELQATIISLNKRIQELEEIVGKSENKRKKDEVTANVAKSCHAKDEKVRNKALSIVDAHNLYEANVFTTGRSTKAMYGMISKNQTKSLKEIREISSEHEMIRKDCEKEGVVIEKMAPENGYFTCKYVTSKRGIVRRCG